MPYKLLLDCDPGLDDALALLLAHGDPNIELVGITTVGGNVALQNTTRNALQLREYLKFPKVPVSAGAAGPLTRTFRDAAHVHGASGLGNVVLPEATLAVTGIHAVDAIIELITATPGTIHLVATGPLTNIALALEKEPAIARWAASFTIMGGSSTRGNATAAAEFNIWADPEAARIVFDADWRVTMIGLDLTLQAQANSIVIDRMKKLGALADELIVPLSTFYFNPNVPDWDGQAVHDVCAVAYVARPDLFDCRLARVDIETTGEFTTGMTVVDFDSPSPNALVATKLDVSGFWAYVETVYARVAAEHTA
ncbi:ribosylpyrimidine nucleosidase [Salinibacterium xinjiangense]|uniref:Purine nucleosidase n=1 Tax=Salinibacterium xinjiangense TaxID=386302 RepID=A0A2C8ZLX8_9MICO|nr:nucleoside hydrolase [Salinibacterium xinjiangense]GGK87332.1 ribosylpyrimidine nucleosidase [Salinibacterium xinjiangense]SOE65917.1 purine nucleosidase [Salinibacterium xinjiangense]